MTTLSTNGVGKFVMTGRIRCYRLHFLILLHLFIEVKSMGIVTQSLLSQELHHFSCLMVKRR